MGVEVRHHAVVFESSFEDGGDIGGIVYGGWVEGKWHGELMYGNAEIRY